MDDTRNPSDHSYLLPFYVPTGNAANNVVVHHIGNAMSGGHLYSVEGNLRALSSGTFSIEVRDTCNGGLIAALDWTEAGSVKKTIAHEFDNQACGIRVDVTSTGTGAEDCSLTIFTRLRR